MVDLTPDLVREKYELRRLLEEHAVRRAMEKVTDEALVELEDYCARMERAGRLGTLRAAIAPSTTFIGPSSPWPGCPPYSSSGTCWARPLGG